MRFVSVLCPFVSSFSNARDLPPSVKSKADVMRVLASSGRILPSTPAAREGSFSSLCPHGCAMTTEGEIDGKTETHLLFQLCGATDVIVLDGDLSAQIEVPSAGAHLVATMTYSGWLAIENEQAQVRDYFDFHSFELTYATTADSYFLTATGTVITNGVRYDFDHERYEPAELH